MAEVLDTRPPRCQEHQVVDGEPVAEMQLVVFQPAGVFLQGQTLFPVFIRIIEQQAFAHGSGQTVDNHQGALRIFFTKVLGCRFAGGIGTAEPAGKGQMKHILARGQERLHKVDKFRRIHLGGGGHTAVSKAFIKSMGGQVFVEAVFIFLPIKFQGKIDMGDSALLIERIRHVTSRIGCNTIAHRNPPLVYHLVFNTMLTYLPISVKGLVRNVVDVHLQKRGNPDIIRSSFVPAAGG